MKDPDCINLSMCLCTYTYLFVCGCTCVDRFWFGIIGGEDLVQDLVQGHLIMKAAIGSGACNVNTCPHNYRGTNVCLKQVPEGCISK